MYTFGCINTYTPLTYGLQKSLPATNTNWSLNVLDDFYNDDPLHKNAIL